jgi:hypothetical protein
VEALLSPLSFRSAADLSRRAVEGSAVLLGMTKGERGAFLGIGLGCTDARRAVASLPLLPTAAEGGVELHQRSRFLLLALRQLQLRIVQIGIGGEHLQIAGVTAGVA